MGYLANLRQIAADGTLRKEILDGDVLGVGGYTDEHLNYLERTGATIVMVDIGVGEFDLSGCVDEEVRIEVAFHQNRFAIERSSRLASR